MAEDFLAQLLADANRAKLLRVFIFDPERAFTAASAGRRAGMNAKHAEKGIKALEELGVIKKGKLSIQIAGSMKRVEAKKQKEKAWMLNPSLKYASALSKFVHEVSPVQYKNIVAGLRKSARLSTVILSGSFMGDRERPADLIVAADGLNESKLESAIKALETHLGREIRYAAFSTPEFRYRLTIQDRLLRDTLDFPHIVLVDKTRLL